MAKMLPWSRLERKIDAHAEDDKRQFDSIAATIALHEANTATRHAQNQTNQALIDAKIDRIEKAIGTIDSLMPAIRAGIAEDERHIYRKKLIKRVIWTIITTLVTISALIPLAQALVGMKLSVHFG